MFWSRLNGQLSNNSRNRWRSSVVVIYKYLFSYSSMYLFYLNLCCLQTFSSDMKYLDCSCACPVMLTFIHFSPATTNSVFHSIVWARTSKRKPGKDILHELELPHSTSLSLFAAAHWIKAGEEQALSAIHFHCDMGQSIEFSQPALGTWLH